METIFSNSTTGPVTGNNPMAQGMAGLFSPAGQNISNIMSQVAEGLNNPSQDTSSTEAPEAPKDTTGVGSFLESMGKKEKDYTLSDALKEAKESGEVDAEEESTEGAEEKKGGRPKTDKNAFVSYIADGAKNGKIALFSDYTEDVPVEEYLAKQPEKRLFELLDKNIEDVRATTLAEASENAAREHYESLPAQYKALYEYAVNGGTDWSQFAQNMQGYQTAQQLDPANEDHQPLIAQNYLQAVGFGTPQMIQKQVAEWVNDGKIEEKAKEFKAPLEGMYQQQLQQIAAEQKEYAMEQQRQAHEYIQSVANTLRKGEVGGLKIDKKLQQDLYQGLTIADKEDINGGYTNELEHLWQKVNYVDRDYDKIARLQWFLKDEASFINAIKQQGKNESVNETFNELKRLGVKSANGSNIIETEADKNKKIKKFQPSINQLFQH